MANFFKTMSDNKKDIDQNTNVNKKQSKDFVHKNLFYICRKKAQEYMNKKRNT
jgi:hypothetical protein